MIVMTRDKKKLGPMRLIAIVALLLLPVLLTAQIRIGGNVYGGGNKGEVKGSTSVTVRSGDIGAPADEEASRPLADPKGKVFGGARMGNVGGNTFVHIDGEHATGYILINQVFGGNDIAGHIGTAKTVNQDIPSELTAVKPADDTDPKKNVVENTYNSYVRLSTKMDGVEPAADEQKIFIGQLFGGGNGDFDYEQTSAGEGKVKHSIYSVTDKAHTTPIAEVITDEGEVGFRLPEIDSTYLEVMGGSIVYAYGGGNNATVKEKTLIHINNPSKVTNYIYVDEELKEVADKDTAGMTNLLSAARFHEMGLNTTFSKPSSAEFQIGRFFGGNNKAEMAIRPTWNLLAGKVRDLYSGGNRGAMTSPEGLLLEIPEYSTLVVDNLYGGCRMADVKPTVDGEYVPCTNLPGYKFPNELAARTLVRGGRINNVYGGNDVTGTVYGGNAIGIYTTVYGNVYGSGNGSYPYTDRETMKDDETYGDLYYETKGGQTSVEALNAFRPNAEQVSLRLFGKDAEHRSIIHGSVFVGGNCASLLPKKDNPLVELKIGSNVIADNVFLGNNGEGMIDPVILEEYKKISSLQLTDPSVFSDYMEGVAMALKPDIVFDSEANGDPQTYIPYSSSIGSFYCGGNVGSMAIPGKMTFTVNQGLNIFNKFVGGCKNADVAAQEGLNAAYEGGILGSTDERTSYTDDAGNIKDRLEINFENLTIVPKRWNEANTDLEWNTNVWREEFVAVEDGTTLTAGKTYYTSDTGDGKFKAEGTEVADGTNYYEHLNDFIPVDVNKDNKNIRLLNGNIYGGCYESGHVNGNVIVNINQDVIKRDEVFYDEETDGDVKSGVNFEGQRDDVLAIALTVFGAGCGEDTEIWGSTTVNHNNGYAFQIFGGGEEGAVGKKSNVLDASGNVVDRVYEFNPAYSSVVNLNGTVTATSNEGEVENLAEADYLYGGGNMGIVSGNAQVNLGNGRIYDAFGGASDADILGHSEVFIGRQPKSGGGYKDGFPWIRDVVYGGNDFGGTIHGEYENGYDFEARLRNYAADKTQLHGYKAGEIPDVLKSASYVEYLQGRVDTIYGGGYGSYDYTAEEFLDDEGNAPDLPYLKSSFVNIRPNNHPSNAIKAAFGAGTGFPGNRDGDKSQDRSYVLIDIPEGNTSFADMAAFGAGSYNGLGMGVAKERLADGTVKIEEASAIVDLLHGRLRVAYGGSFNEGVTRRTMVNVPAESNIQIDNIFGGAYGTKILPPCDVYETQVNYKNTSEKAQVFGAIYGGNNYQRRSIFTQVNISSPVYSNKAKGYTGTVYGAGRGYNSWAEYTEVNLEKGARLYNVYGGAELGHVLNSASVQAYHNMFKDHASPEILAEVSDADKDPAAWVKAWKAAWTVGDYYTPNGLWNDYANNPYTSFAHVSDRPELDAKTADQLDGQKKHNTNVIINKGAVVEGYAYGGGLGNASIVGSGDVYGSTYIAVLGGEVKKDVYAGGRTGGVDNLFGADDFSDPGNAFVATANAYVQGGTARNVYGGGYEGHVGYHQGAISASYASDRPAKSYVVIGKSGTNTFEGGAPAITRNVYGGGEGGSVYGSSNVTINNGYVGYRYKNTGSKYEYVEELDDQTPNAIEMAGNVFGGGYVINSFVDSTTVNMLGGTVRGSLYGGGEIGPVGRGTMKSGSYTVGLANGDAHIFRAGTTNVNMFSGHVLRNVFGGGRGKDSWGGDGTLYMDPTLVATLDMKSKGFVYGQTRVNIHGGEIGTDEGMAKGYGNVFGGGDEGSVYSAYMDGGNLRIGLKDGVRYDNNKEGYYYASSDGSSYLTKAGSSERILTEDCKVLVAPYAKALGNVSINGHSYTAGAFVPIDDLNTMKSKTADTKWQYLDPSGIVIHNAVFAGGNIAAGSSSLYANAKTVFGNATASIHDVYNRDLITIGTGHTGGLYGDGNLTFVDGYRELNITNYGTDYYHIAKELTYDQYKELPVREQAYYELKYTLKEGVGPVTADGVTYSEGSSLPQDEILALFDGTDKVLEGKPNPYYWQENGVVSVYAGRIMNTIQRADFCGVFGSRMVMKGAPDRVPEKVDYTNYTINRVREVSLNKKTSVAGDTDANATHGNYFGIYSVVNFLGALTSDVKFSDVRQTNSSDASVKADGETTFYEWKEANVGNKKRNNGTCHNHLALASGVYLELTTEQSTGTSVEKKDWGPITGVIELDLINVQTGVGGGFVYAKNEHGVPTPSGLTTTTLTALNRGAASKKDYTYAIADVSRKKWETSGNFIHSSQTIIDDCYNVSNRYLSTNFVKAHYWYIAGTIYVYDQYISAYTGMPNAFRETVELPITINAASHGTMTLMDVKPNRYAYYATYTDASVNTPLTGDRKLVINNVTYQKNSPISYWDWSKLPAAERKLFVEDTYVTVAGCKIGGDTIYAGTVMLPSDYERYKGLAPIKKIDKKEVKAVTSNGRDVAFDDVFRSSNNLSHTTGYLLTYDVTNPKKWDDWYTLKSSSTREKKQTGGDLYHDGPTYHPTVAGVYGQQAYREHAIISQKIYDDYAALSPHTPSDGQATFVRAHLVTSECTSDDQHYYPGAPVSSAIDGHTSLAFVSTATIQLSSTEYIYVNDLMTGEQKEAFMTAYPSLSTEIEKSVVPAYYCTVAGLYGGTYYETDKNYRALEAYSAMSAEDRAKFEFNYDALDLLIDPAYGGTVGQKYQYDAKAATLDAARANAAGYSLTQPIDYTATYDGSNLSLTSPVTVTRGGKAVETSTLQKDDELLSTVYESLPNDQHYYAPILVEAAGGDYYVVNTSFVHGDTPYAVGSTMTKTAYDGLATTEQKFVSKLSFSSTSSATTYYYCREGYTIKSSDYTAPLTGVVKSVNGVGTDTTYTTNVPAGIVISAADYTDLVNKQKNFTIHGVSPMETSTLYVSRNADINDLSTEKIITVVYKYDYEESDEDGLHIVPVSERHVVNIHIRFKSGVPIVDDINAPTIVLPGTGVSMRIPSVTPGAYEVIGGGWELFEKPGDAESHVNGVEYTPGSEPLYWYQDGYQLAYYAKTFLGKTYSNHVPVTVANYHDLKRVMDDKQNHLHVDYDRTRLKRNSKIYINDYSASGRNGLLLFKDFYDLSLITAGTTGITLAGDSITNAGHRLKGHKLLNNSANGVKAGQHLEFFLRTDISVPSDSLPWTPIGTDKQCFEGTLHGDGHTISGLDNSLFCNLCGSVYNLGVTGSFTSAGVVDKGDGYVESSWINTTGTPNGSVRAVFGDPTASGSGVKQLVNSYCQTGKTYSTTDDGSHGLATAKSDTAFYNGEVAYDLNNFYLYKRYSDHTVLGGSPVEYKYWKSGQAEPQTGRYAANESLCSSGYNGITYVEDRFADGDFRYAAGEIPTWQDERRYVIAEEDNREVFYPIWPDDYIFFGQRLTYGYGAYPHQSVPTAVTRADGRLSDAADANRVYRAPAYYGNMQMGVAHFNPAAYLAQHSSDGTKTAYPGMTAIDFAGHNDAFEANGANKTYELGMNAQGRFYAPLLDDDGLTAITNCDETQNLLAYAPAAASASGYANAKTHAVLSTYFTEPLYADYYDNTSGYRLVAEAPTSGVHGHLVQHDLTATNDHLLVDLQDFNAPIAYSFDGDHLMWYQRTPANNQFVDRNIGWQAISVPFTAELVSTDEKGEITHFHGGSEESQNGTHTKIGHEYWLREFSGITEDVESEPDVAHAAFQYPTAGGTDKIVSKTVGNTFLWDYYYKNEELHDQQDLNKDTYLQYRKYYNSARSYTQYPLLTAATPYLLGLPGQTYYEFDLSGKFEAENTAVSVPKLSKQTITLASDKGESIAVSDDETPKTVQHTLAGTGSKDYTFAFHANYRTQHLTTTDYALNAAGSAFDKVTSDGGSAVAGGATAVPFRPYFTATSAAKAGARKQLPRSIVFDGVSSQEVKDDPDDAVVGGLEIYAKDHKIFTTSHLKQPVTITVVNVGGGRVANYVLQPGETVATRVRYTGIYLVNKKKLFVR